MNDREINIGTHFPQVVLEDFQQLGPIRHSKSTKTRFKMLRMSWTV